MGLIKNTMEESFKEAGEYLGASAPKHRGTTRQDYIDFLTWYDDIGHDKERIVNEYLKQK